MCFTSFSFVYYYLRPFQRQGVVFANKGNYLVVFFSLFLNKVMAWNAVVTGIKKFSLNIDVIPWISCFHLNQKHWC